MTARISVSQRGMTLIELMVALTIGLFLALAVTTVISVTLHQQKTTASVNERDQASTFAMAQLDKTIRSAGSGFAYWMGSGSLACRLNASKGGVQLLPATLAAPFASVSALQSPFMAPVLIEKGVGTNGSDVLFVMSGHGKAVDVPRALVPSVSKSLPVVGLYSSVGLSPNDLVLAAGISNTDCYISQIASNNSSNATLSLGGAYYASSTGLQALVTGDSSFLIGLGGSTGGYPVMRLLGVGSGDTLYQYDMLHLVSNTPQPVAEDVSHLFALYGIDTTGVGKVDTWVDPGSADWTPAAIKASSDNRISKVLAIRVAVVTHSHGVKQANVSPEKLYAFADLGTSLQRQITLTADQRSERYRVTESIIPIRNSLLIN